MKFLSFGIVCLAFISAASSQYAFSKAVIANRKALVAHHCVSLASLDKTYWTFFEFVRDTATAAFALLKPARDNVDAAFKSVGPLSSNSRFATYNYSVVSQLNDPITRGVDSVLGPLGTSPLSDWSAPARDIAMFFSSLMSTLTQYVGDMTYGNQQAKPDDCIDNMFKVVWTQYDTVYNNSINQAKTATAYVKKVGTEITALAKKLSTSVNTLASKILACKNVESCLEALYDEYTNNYDFAQSLMAPSMQFQTNMSSLSMTYPGYYPSPDYNTPLMEAAKCGVATP